MSNEQMKFHITKYSLEPVEDSRFVRLKMYVLHEGDNKNSSSFPLSVIEEAEGSILNVPILSYIFESDADFGEHEMEYDEETDEITYIEKPIGVIPALQNNYHYEEVEGRNYVVVHGYIWADYAADSVEIIERDQDVKISAELIIDQSKYNFKTKILNVEKFRYRGITLLGKKYGTGMYNTHAQIENFSSNSEEFNGKVSELNKFLIKFSLDENKESEILGEVKEELSSNFAIDKTEENNEINKEVKSVPKKKEIAAIFSLTAMQMYDELSKVIGEVTYLGEDWDGKPCLRSKYYLQDFDDSFVYVVDRMNDYMNMKIPYTKSGDNFTLDYEGASRIKYTPTDWDGANEDPDYNEEDEIIVMSLAKQIQEEGKVVVQSVKEATQAEFSEQLEAKVSEKETEKQDAVFSINAKLEEKQVELDGLQLQLNELVEFKQFSIDSVRKEKVDALFASHVKHFKQEEIDSLREKESTFETFELFEKDFKSFAYDRIVQTFSETGTKPLLTFVEIPENTKQEQVETPKTIWDKLD